MSTINSQPAPAPPTETRAPSRQRSSEPTRQGAPTATPPRDRVTVSSEARGPQGGAGAVVAGLQSAFPPVQSNEIDLQAHTRNRLNSGRTTGEERRQLERDAATLRNPHRSAADNERLWRQPETPPNTGPGLGRVLDTLERSPVPVPGVRPLQEVRRGLASEDPVQRNRQVTGGVAMAGGTAIGGRVGCSLGARVGLPAGAAAGGAGGPAGVFGGALAGAVVGCVAGYFGGGWLGGQTGLSVGRTLGENMVTQPPNIQLPPHA